MGGRPGLTTVELLLAAALGLGLVGVALQTTFEYFKLKRVLLERTELRHAAQVAQERVAAQLRFTGHVLALTPDTYLLVTVQDRDRCGYACYMDRFTLRRWDVASTAGARGRTYLREVRFETAAFALPAPEDEIRQLLSKAQGRTTVVADAVSRLRINQAGEGLYRTEVAVRGLTEPRRPATEVVLRESVAARTRPRFLFIPTLRDVLEDRPWRGHQPGGAASAGPVAST